MDYNEFLNTTKVVRMLYGLSFATDFFEQNIALFPNKFENGKIVLTDETSNTKITDNT